MRKPCQALTAFSRSGLAVLALIAMPGLAAATTVNISASADATLYEDAGGLIADGAGDYFFAGKTNQPKLRRGIIKFDLGVIPSGATVTAVTLKLHCSKTPSPVTSYSFTMHKVTNSWSEGTVNDAGDEGDGSPSTANSVTWKHRVYSGTLWTNLGGDFTGSSSASASVTDVGFYTWGSTATLVSDVQGWVNNSATNFGWIIKGNEGVQKSAKRFDSRTNATSANRPVLTVTYTPPPASGACCFTDGSCIESNSATCNAMLGTYQGNGTDCTPNPCPQPAGACCAPSGTCTSVTEASCIGGGGTWQGAFTSCGSSYCPVNLSPFQDALPIPSVIAPTSVGPDGIENYDVYIREFNYSLHASLPQTRVWGYNSQYPGPTFEVRKGHPIRVTWHNDLRNVNNVLRNTHIFPYNSCLHGPNITGRTPVTVTHLHGLKVAPESDGFPDLSFGPGFSSPQYFYPNDQQATTLWYHDHALGMTRLNVYAGLAGFYLIRDDAEDALNLPRGQYEIPLVIQDRNIDVNGNLRYNPDQSDAFFGDKIVVNGKVWPFLNVNKGKYRFRIVNGSNTRAYTLALRPPPGGAIPFQQIGTDGGLLPAPVTISSLTVLPGERADIVIDFAPITAGSFLTLANSAPAPFPGTPGVGVISNVMVFRVQAAAGDTDPLPATLIPVPPIPEAQATVTRTQKLRLAAVDVCSIDTWLINDLLWDDITEFPHIGATEIWEFANMSNITHPLHIHLVQFQILDRQDFILQNNQIVLQGPKVPPAANEAGWKDTVQCPPNQVSRVIAKFEGFTGTFPYHCHILEHEDHEMMRQFMVICDPPVINVPPVGQTKPQGSTASFTVAAGGDEVAYKWQRNGVAIQDGPTAWGSTVSGSNTPTLTISVVHPLDQDQYRCLLKSVCGFVQTGNVGLVVTPSCPGDLNFDGVINTADLTILLVKFGQSVQPGTDGDLNADGQVNTADLTLLLVHFGQFC